MKFVKIIIGLLALAFVGFHIAELPAVLQKSHGQIDFASAFWIGKIAAMLIGFAIAIRALRSAFKTE